MGIKKCKRIIVFCMVSILSILNIQFSDKNIITVKAAGGIKQINLGASVLSTSGYTDGKWTTAEGIKVYLGIAPQGDDGTSNFKPMPYRVLTSDGVTSAFLDGDTSLAHYLISANTTPWANSETGQWLENTFYGGNQYFSNIEKSLIQATNLAENSYEITDKNGTTIQVKDEAATLHVFSMSAYDVNHYYSTAELRRKSNAHHYLRSLQDGTANWFTVESGGAISLTSEPGVAKQYVRMCPTMNISLDSVAFTKAYSYTDGNFAPVSAMTGNDWTLALKDGNTAFSATRSDSSHITVRKGGEMQITIDNSASGYSYTQISGMLVDSTTGEILCYGKIADASAGSTSVDIPEGLQATDDYLLYVFAEQTNGQGRSSYVSNMITIPFNVETLYDVNIEISADATGIITDGNTFQRDVLEMDTVTILADDTHYFPDDYASNILFKEQDVISWDTVNDLSYYGITVTKISSSKIEISGTLNNSVFIVMPDASPKYETGVTFDTYESIYVYGDSAPTIKAIAAPVDELSGIVIPQDKVVYTSSDTSVADVDSSTGKVTIKNVGTFKITATLTDGEDYLGTVSETDKITVLPKNIDDSVKVTFADSDTHVCDGQPWKPKFSVEYGGKKLVEDIDYKVVCPEDNIEPGEKLFTIMFTGVYTGACQIKGTIDEAPAVFVMPEKTYTQKVETGKESYYVSPLTLVAPEGYYISTDSDEGFGKSVTFYVSDDDAVIYLKDAKTGAVSDAIKVPAFKIDSNAPVIPGIEDKSEVYGSSYSLVVSDLNLKELTINGHRQEIKGAIVTIELSANYGVEGYVIRAVDEAGNVTKLTFTLAEEWTKTGLIPAAQTVHLKGGKSYKLDEGTWTIQGDSTQYRGGIDFYIQTEGLYVFDRQ